jgi:hypothetical protein
VRQFSVFCLAAGIAAALVGPASGGKAGLSGNLCTTVPKGALVALKVTAPCINQKPHVSVQATPLGSVRTVAYRARWGTDGGTVSQPRTYFAAQAIYVQGASAAVAYAQKHFRAEVLAHGIPISSHPLATEDAETAALPQPADRRLHEGHDSRARRPVRPVGLLRGARSIPQTRRPAEPSGRRGERPGTSERNQEVVRRCCQVGDRGPRLTPRREANPRAAPYAEKLGVTSPGRRPTPESHPSPR